MKLKVTSAASVLAVVLAVACVAPAFAQQRDRDSEFRSGRCLYLNDNAHFDTCACGAVADYSANRLLWASDVRVIVIDGFAGPGESTGIEVRRAANAQRYLTEFKGIDPDRIVLRWLRVSRIDNRQWPGRLRITLVGAGEPLPALIAPPVE